MAERFHVCRIVPGAGAAGAPGFRLEERVTVERFDTHDAAKVARLLYEMRSPRCRYIVLPLKAEGED